MQPCLVFVFYWPNKAAGPNNRWPHEEEYTLFVMLLFCARMGAIAQQWAADDCKDNDTHHGRSVVYDTPRDLSSVLYLFILLYLK